MPAPFKPTIPPRVRTVVYISGLVVGVASILATGITGVWWPEHAAAVAATAGTVSSAAAFLAGATGVVYRPTHPEAPAGRHSADGPA